MDVPTGRVYISRDVVFDESVFPFESLHPNAAAILRKEILLLPSHLQSFDRGGDNCTNQFDDYSSSSTTAMPVQVNEENTGENGMENDQNPGENEPVLHVYEGIGASAKHEEDPPALRSASDHARQSPSDRAPDSQHRRQGLWILCAHEHQIQHRTSHTRGMQPCFGI